MKWLHLTKCFRPNASRKMTTTTTMMKRDETIAKGFWRKNAKKIIRPSTWQKMCIEDLKEQKCLTKKDWEWERIRLASYLTVLTSTKQVNMLFIQRKKSGLIERSKTGDQLYNDTSPYEVSRKRVGGGIGRVKWANVCSMCEGEWSQRKTQEEIRQKDIKVIVWKSARCSIVTPKHCNHGAL